VGFQVNEGLCLHAYSEGAGFALVPSRLICLVSHLAGPAIVLRPRLWHMLSATVCASCPFLGSTFGVTIPVEFLSRFTLGWRLGLWSP